MPLQDCAGSTLNATGTDCQIGTPVTQPRSPSDPRLAALKSALHGARIRNGGDYPVTARMTILHDGTEHCEGPDLWPDQRAYQRAVIGRTVRELRGLRPALPAPRVAVKGGTE